MSLFEVNDIDKLIHNEITELRAHYMYSITVFIIGTSIIIIFRNENMANLMGVTGLVVSMLSIFPIKRTFDIKKKISAYKLLKEKLLSGILTNKEKKLIEEVLLKNLSATLEKNLN